MMLGAIFNSLSGMSAYSRGLEVISNNVANLNTAGFKVSIPTFSDMAYQSGSGTVIGGPGAPGSGAGVNVDSSRQSFRQGDLRETGNPLDAAIDGNGFFILDRDGQLVFTRAGQFEFDEDGVLVDRRTAAKVMMSTDASSLTSFSLDAYRTYPPQTTTQVDVAGNLARPPAETTYELTAIDVVDTVGAKQTLKSIFVRNETDPLQWSVELVDALGNTLGQGSLRFRADGTLDSDGGGVAVTVNPVDSAPFALTVRFGTPGSYSGTTSLSSSTSSSLQVLRQDGKQLGALSQIAFDERGELNLTYSNGEIAKPTRLLLAQFAAPDQLESLGDGLFIPKGGQQPTQAGPLTQGLGRVVGGRLELSNVDLTEQFTDLIIIQRGYQGSSQITSVANEMIQQLLQIESGR